MNRDGRGKPVSPMKLGRLLQACPAARLREGSAATEIAGLAYDSRAVQPGFLFFALPGDFRIIHDYPRFWRFGKRIVGNSSVYRFELGAHADVLENFRANTEEMRAKYRNEQEYLSHFLHKQGKLDYWPAAWCPSFKYYCIPTWPSNYWKEPVPPTDARIVIFHGEVNPPDALQGKRNKRFRHIQPAKWIEQAWG